MPSVVAVLRSTYSAVPPTTHLGEPMTGNDGVVLRRHTALYYGSPAPTAPSDARSCFILATESGLASICYCT